MKIYLRVLFTFEIIFYIDIEHIYLRQETVNIIKILIFSHFLFDMTQIK